MEYKRFTTMQIQYIHEAISGGLALRHHMIMIIVGKKAGRGVDSSPRDRRTP